MENNVVVVFFHVNCFTMYTTLVSIEEFIHEILMNLKENILWINLYETRDMSICFQGPKVWDM